MKSYKAKVKMDGRYVEVVIQAQNIMDAKSMLEAQYGKGSITNGPHQVG